MSVSAADHVLHFDTQWLEIKPTDDEKTRNRKKKLQKSFKNKKRFQDMDALTRKKQQNWQDFKTGKGAKKKVTFTGQWPCHVLEVPSAFSYTWVPGTCTWHALMHAPTSWHRALDCPRCSSCCRGLQAPGKRRNAA